MNWFVTNPSAIGTKTFFVMDTDDVEKLREDEGETKAFEERDPKTSRANNLFLMMLQKT